MKNFKSNRKLLEYTQLNTGNIDDVFSLLCPVREKDCVFITPYNDKYETVWQVTQSQYDKNTYKIEFLRVTPKHNVAIININFKSISNNNTQTKISYQYTSLSIQKK